MASATRLPLKSIAFTTALVLTASASRISLRNVLVNGVTGPGKYSRILATILVLLNLKSVPFAWHVSPPFRHYSLSHSYEVCTALLTAT
jgi:hypothetical protein